MKKKQKRRVFQKGASILMLALGAAILLIAVLEIGGFGLMRTMLDVELGARQLSELLMVLGIFNFVFSILSITAGILGCLYASKTAEKLQYCKKAGVWALIVLAMYGTFLVAVNAFAIGIILMTVITLMYLVSVFLNEKQQKEAEVTV